jgi:hypothetical protein
LSIYFPLSHCKLYHGFVVIMLLNLLDKLVRYMTGVQNRVLFFITTCYLVQGLAPVWRSSCFSTFFFLCIIILRRKKGNRSLNSTCLYQFFSTFWKSSVLEKPKFGFWKIYVSEKLHGCDTIYDAMTMKLLFFIFSSYLVAHK